MTPDTRPGFYYVTAQDGPRTALLLGPYRTHEHALACVDSGRELANEVTPWAAFWAFGTSRSEVDLGPGKLHDRAAA